MRTRLHAALPVLATALLGAAIVPARADAQSHADLVYKQLAEAYDAAQRNGFESLNYILGSLEDSDGDTWTFVLREDMKYKIVGACDADCSDVDVEVLDSDGTVIAKDLLDDDEPIVNFTVPKGGRYTFRVTMAECSDEPCFYGIAIFQK